MTSPGTENRSHLEALLLDKDEGVKYYHDLYTKINLWVKSHWTNKNLVPGQVWHGYDHTTALLAYADILLFPYAKENLEAREIFLLLSSIRLHDTCMHYGWKELCNIEGHEGDLEYDGQVNIRTSHTVNIGKLIRSFTDQSERIPAGLRDSLNDTQKNILADELNEELAIICESHGKPLLQNHLKTYKYNNDYKIELIAATLQACDSFHMDKTRISHSPLKDYTEQAEKGNPEVYFTIGDWKRHYQCAYIETVALKNENGIFTVQANCRFSRKEKEFVKNGLKEIYRQRLTKKPGTCISILETHGIRFREADPVNEFPAAATVDPLPEFLYADIVPEYKKAIKALKENQLQKHRFFQAAESGGKGGRNISLLSLNVEVFSSIQYKSELSDSLRKGREKTPVSLRDAFGEMAKAKKTSIFILGEPGAGKTFYLKSVLLGFYDDPIGPKNLKLRPDMIPIYIRLSEYQDKAVGFVTFLHDRINTLCEKPANHAFAECLMKRGNLLFLLDGLDEISDADGRKTAFLDINRLASIKGFNANTYVLTCRFEGYKKLPDIKDDFLQLEITAFDPEQAGAFIKNWLMNFHAEVYATGDSAQKKANDLVEKVKAYEDRYGSRNMTRLLENPLLLSNLCIVYTRKNELPEKISKLFLECINVLLEDWQHSKEIDVDLNSEDGKRILMPVAWAMHAESMDLIKRTELEKELGRVFKIINRKELAADFIEKIINISGILTGIDTDTLKFMHLGFQEYLAAREIRRRWCEKDDIPMKLLAENYAESWWTEVAMHLVALEEPSVFVPYMEALLEKIRPEDMNLLDRLLDVATETSSKPFVHFFSRENKGRQDLIETLRIKLELKGILTRSQPWVTIISDPIELNVKISGKFSIEKTVIEPETGYKLILIPHGTYFMGCDTSKHEDERPVHPVTIKSFYMGRYPVTNRQYEVYLKENSKIRKPEYWKEDRFNRPDQPVVGISWDEAKQFAQWLSGISNVEYRLPSEAEWEYACRAGTTTEYYPGNHEADLAKAGWYEKNSDRSLHPVGEKEPNAFGLYDMHGNVWEWVEDDWHENYEGGPDTEKPVIKNPRSDYRVLRGGCWGNSAADCRSAIRHRFGPSNRYYDFGFRLSRSL